ncbi:Rpn14p NDAI_0D03490 [Naumovozyma dairenensis CBS 421]|uniref:Uncharacterized protein n=1 Tax=Naumovozyma dairenensis (strain ATCC 10597 / BCRC 20456 / CBS 421 / NBRC 0211 / NRRL Y-12639) TaxID=1071378 RepID=G0WA52_NAUDC|nr:hypothetical protein NDAI_0D03490 [Naumovozyma dairenensis CBS 421]CCD24663.1 hypothetical protein NDAI_0D03490 [Naumovozyma dairenensis CBS 421]
MTNMKHTIPVFHIQPDFHEVIEDLQNPPRTDDKRNQTAVDEDAFYINMDRTLNEVKEYRIRVSNKGTRFQPVHDRQNTFNHSSQNGRLYNAELDGQQSEFLIPDWTWQNNIDYQPSILNNKTFTSIDVIQNNSAVKFAVGDNVGNISVFDDTMNLTCQLDDAHFDEISNLKIFPSGEVLLSASIDMQLKIWSLKDGSNPRTFLGHKGKVTDTVLIERGRNFLSSSRDGSIRLWECSTGTTIRTFTRKENPNDAILSMGLLSNDNPLTNEPASMNGNSLDFGTKGKTVISSHKSGVLTLHDVFTKESLLQMPSIFMEPCNSVIVNPQDNNYVYAGYENGSILIWDIRSNTVPLEEVVINKGIAINALKYYDNKLAISSGTDTSLLLDLDSSGSQFQNYIPTFLVNDDCQVTSFATDSKKIYIVGNNSFWASFKL